MRDAPKPLPASSPDRAVPLASGCTLMIIGAALSLGGYAVGSIATFDAAKHDRAPYLSHPVDRVVCRDSLEVIAVEKASEACRRYPVVEIHKGEPDPWVGTVDGDRLGAICSDGSRSSATGRGACSHHGGVSRWLTSGRVAIVFWDYTRVYITKGLILLGVVLLLAGWRFGGAAAMNAGPKN